MSSWTYPQPKASSADYHINYLGRRTQPNRAPVLDVLAVLNPHRPYSPTAAVATIIQLSPPSAARFCQGRCGTSSVELNWDCSRRDHFLRMNHVMRERRLHPHHARHGREQERHAYGPYTRERRSERCRPYLDWHAAGRDGRKDETCHEGDTPTIDLTDVTCLDCLHAFIYCFLPLFCGLSALRCMYRTARRPGINAGLFRGKFQEQSETAELRFHHRRV